MDNPRGHLAEYASNRPYVYLSRDSDGYILDRGTNSVGFRRTYGSRKPTLMLKEL